MVFGADLSGPLSCGIYKILCEPTGKSYIGSAVNFVKRWRTHLHYLRNNSHHSKHLQNAWNKYGEASFKFTRMLACDKKDLLLFEQRALDIEKPEFNICKIAGSLLGFKHSEETRKKFSICKRGNTATKGRKHRPESIALMRDIAKKQVRSYLVGIKQSPEFIEKRVAKHRGMKRSEEARANISKAMTGKKRKPYSEVTLLKLQLVNQGKGSLTDDQVREIRAATGPRGFIQRLAEKYNVTYSLISMIRSMKRYGWVPNESN